MRRRSRGWRRTPMRSGGPHVAQAHRGKAAVEAASRGRGRGRNPAVSCIPSFLLALRLGSAAVVVGAAVGEEFRCGTEGLTLRERSRGRQRRRKLHGEADEASAASVGQTAHD